MINRFSQIFVLSLVIGQAFPVLAQNETIVTDRPGRMNATTSVGNRVFQAELGTYWTRILDEDLRSETYGFSQIALRYGLGNGTEIRLGHDFTGFKYVYDDLSRGVDLSNQSTLGVKQALTADPDARSKMAVVAQWFIPLDEGKFDADRSAIDVSLPISIDLTNTFGLGLMPGATFNDLDLNNTTYYGAFFVNLAPAPQWAFYSQWYFQRTYVEGSPASPVGFYPGVGGTYQINENSQIDLSFELQSKALRTSVKPGILREQDYNIFFIGAGYSLRLVPSKK